MPDTTTLPPMRDLHLKTMPHRALLIAYRDGYAAHRKARGSKARLAATMRIVAVQAELLARMGPEPK
jgi:hypothetical protein